MSPEQAEGRPVDQRSDIFSFGVVLYEMVTGARAFEASTILSTLTKVLRDDPQPLLELSPTAPLDLAGIIARCIRKNPAERYQSMREVHQGLAAVRLERQAAATRDAVTVLDAIPPVIVTPPPPVSSRGWKPMVWVGGLLAIPLLALGIFIGTRIARSPAPAAVESVPRTTPPERPRVGDSGKPSPSVAPDAPKAEPDSPPAPPAATATPAVRQVKLMDGTPVRLALDEAVERTVDIGVVVKLHVVSDVTADGAVVIAKGAEASGVVVESGKKTLLRRRPKVTMRLQRVRLVDGKSASLRPTAERRTEGMVVDTAGGADHLVKPGEGAVAGKGTEYWSYVDGDVVLVMEEK
jgi:serine/threonine-protein kinase